MGLFDAFTGAPARRAAEQTRQHLAGVQTQGLADISQAFNAAPQYITAGTAGARGDLGRGYGAARADLTTGNAGAIDFLNQGTTSGLDALSRAYSEGRGAFDPLTGLAQKFGAGSTLYMDALGINGPEGTERARASFKAGPGYDFRVNEALEGINRARAASGQLVGGNTDRAVMDRAFGLADQEYDSYLDRLGGFVAPELQATTGAATGLAELARSLGMSESDLLTRMGTAKSGVAERGGTSLAQLAAGEGGKLADLTMGEGRSLADLATGRAAATTGLRTSLAQPYTNTYGQEAAAQMQGSANLWGGILNGALGAARIAGGMPGGAPNLLPTSAAFGGTNPFSFGA